MPWISHGAFIVALLWIVHPVHSAAVDYISGRADSLAFFLRLRVGFCFCARDASHGFLGSHIHSMFFAASCGLLALLSREIACVWIALFVAHLLFVERQVPLRFRMVTLVCCAGLITIYLGFRQLPEQRLTPGTTKAGWTAPVRAVLMARALGDYGRLMVFPSKLTHGANNFLIRLAIRVSADWRQSIGTEYLSILGLVLLAVLVCGSHQGRARANRAYFRCELVSGRVSADLQHCPIKRHCRRALALLAKCRTPDFSCRMRDRTSTSIRVESP